MDTGDTVPADLGTTLGDGRSATLGDWRGRWLVLYFYPKDSTPGCTTEGGDFNALLDAFAERDAAVVGVSRDPVASHARFAAKQGYRFDLASDSDETLCRAFDVIREKKMYGRTVLGIERSTFLIDPQGRVARAWRKVKVAGHAQAVLAALDEAR